MGLTSINPTSTAAWEKLRKHHAEIKNQEIKGWFSKDPNRVQKLSITWKDFRVDYSKNRITDKTVALLLELAGESRLKEAIDKQFEGEAINETENREVLHTALRASTPQKEVKDVLQKMEKLSTRVLDGSWKGYTGKAITDVVNIGIGGSDLGPRMATDALKYYKTPLNVHFISNVDGDQSAELTQRLSPETTLIIIVSKSFRTQETLRNAHLFKDWFLKSGAEKDIAKHFVAVSSNTEAAVTSGIAKENVLPMWDWVGGRFSVWSAVGLSLCCAIGFDNFKKFLRGAQQMDTHFQATPLHENIPVILGLLSVWYNNFFEAETEAILPYSHYLERLVPYLQQAIMESNGKSISRDGKHVNYQTGNIIWGSTGTNAQHAFFQLLHQGTKLVPCEFIGYKHPLHGNTVNHNQLMANFFGQTEALMKGKTKEEVEAEWTNLSGKERAKLAPFKEFEGNKPSTTILMEKLTPESFGSLIALYEHKIFVQGVIWNIFSYDQWGVEYGKQLATTILAYLDHDEQQNGFEGSTKVLLEYYKK